MRDIAVVLSNDNKNTAPFETADAIKKAGFKNVFVQWYNKDWHPTQLQQLDYVRSRGLKVIFAHLGYQNINALWEEGDDGDALTERFLDDIYDCYAEDLNLLVMHLTSKSEAPAYGEIGLERIQKLADYAATLGVKLALENTKIPGYQEYVIQNISNKNLGICYDAGHCHAHFGDKFDFSIFKDRIFAVHLHDNDGTADQHLIPFDGTIDWKNVISGLKSANYDGPITLELCYQNAYLDTPILKFYRDGMAAAQKLQSMF